MADDILAAARHAIAARGLDATTIEDIAAEAGVSRATLYRRSGGREAILVEVLRREAEPFVSETNAAVGERSGLTERLIAGLVYAIDALPRYPLLHAVFGSTTSDAKLKIVRPVFRALVDATLLAVLADARASGIPVRDFDPDELADWLLRDFLYVASQAPWPQGELERYLATFVMPVLQPGLPPPGTVQAFASLESIDRMTIAIDVAAREAAGLRRQVAEQLQRGK
ncbi:TetR/AcrR family transcriptional regulator [Sphingobium sp. Z007]|uniref:TetR/AcrR family transcriptional regulator n=1 Tax=Sphingobium sp. Z007 TaxID=627495 RepID=UPI001595155E|nr:TetR/AcrR family transcriptional regulator [Sphingobium sp. Z007]